MDKTVMKALAGVLLGGVSLVALSAHHDCPQRQLCEVKGLEPPHTHERQPGPTRTVDTRQVVVASTTTSTGIYSITQNMAK